MGREIKGGALGRQVDEEASLLELHIVEASKEDKQQTKAQIC
jgi:hypothetical protein